jgi:uncharacterized protein YgiB involved in biofilm formation
MKRSRSIELTLMSAVPFLLVACDSPHGATSAPLVYRSVSDCIAGGQVPEDTCRSEYANAQALHQQQAPRFSALEDCEARYGYDQCTRAHSADGSSIFLPLMAGYLIGHAFGNHGYPYGYYYGGWHGQPIYRDRGGDRAAWRTGNGAAVAYGEGIRGPAAMGTAQTLSRGGFGMSSAARGSWGG